MWRIDACDVIFSDPEEVLGCGTYGKIIKARLVAEILLCMDKWLGIVAFIKSWSALFSQVSRNPSGSQAAPRACSPTAIRFSSWCGTGN